MRGLVAWYGRNPAEPEALEESIRGRVEKQSNRVKYKATKEEEMAKACMVDVGG